MNLYLEWRIFSIFYLLLLLLLYSAKFQCSINSHFLYRLFWNELWWFLIFLSDCCFVNFFWPYRFVNSWITKIIVRLFDGTFKKLAYLVSGFRNKTIFICQLTSYTYLAVGWLASVNFYWIPLLLFTDFLQLVVVSALSYRVSIISLQKS